MKIWRRRAGGGGPAAGGGAPGTGWGGTWTRATRAARACTWVSCCAYLPEADDMAVLRTAYGIHLAQGHFPDAMRLALKLGDKARPRIGY